VAIPPTNQVREVAAKTPRDDGGGAQSIAHEVNMMQLLHHPNVMRPLAVFKDPPYIGYAMDAIQGLDLKELVQHLKAQGQSQELPELLGDLMILLMPALNAIHVAGIAHRDIKLSNIMVSIVQRGSKYDHIPIICDFGVAIQSGSAHYEVSGTKVFHPPEYATTKITTFDGAKAADVYALGLMIVDFITGWHRSPSQNPGVPNDIMEEVQKFEGYDLVRFVSSMLIADPQLRPTMQELLLHSWLVTQFTDRGLTHLLY